MGRYSSLFARILILPWFTRCPPPQEELAAAESVTIELAEAISISPLCAKLSSYREIQCDGLPSFLLLYISAIFKVPELIPSLTIKMMFLAFFPPNSSLRILALVPMGVKSNPPNASEPPFKKSRLLIIPNFFSNVNKHVLTQYEF